MRQAGVLAAAGLIALEEHPPKLAADHAHAKLLAALLEPLPGVQLDPAKVETNIVVFEIMGTGLTPETITARLKDRGVLINKISDTEMRAVTHYDVSEEDCRCAARALEEVLT
jgi:threonine aldolase